MHKPLSERPEASLLSGPFQSPPPQGTPVEIAPGILWVRFALPFRLDHVNIYLLDDGDGWAVLDTGIGNDQTREAWQKLLAEHLDRPLTRLIVTHYHPDHVGMAGWLAEQFRLPLHMSQTDYLVSRNIHLDPGALQADFYRQFYLNHGLSPEVTDRVVTQGHRYLKIVTGLPPTFRRMTPEDRFAVGRREFRVFTYGGHAPEQVLLYSEAENLFFAADQILSKISPNVSVSAMDPTGDPLNLYLKSLDAIATTVAADALVLPGHGLPFCGLHIRIKELKAHHAKRCAQILAACRASPKTAAEIIPLIFHRPLDPHEMGFAFSEVLAHINYMLRRKELVSDTTAAGLVRVRAAVK